jgi:hypothetical protein
MWPKHVMENRLLHSVQGVVFTVIIKTVTDDKNNN